MSISVARRKTMNPKPKLGPTETRRSTASTITCSSITSMRRSSQLFFASLKQRIFRKEACMNFVNWQQESKNRSGILNPQRTASLATAEINRPKNSRNPDTDELSREKLTNNEPSFLTSNIQRGGGAYIYPNVQKKWDWIKWARKEKVCGKCASSKHLGDTCLVQAKDTGKGSDHSRKGGNKNSLHAMITAMEAEEI